MENYVRRNILENHFLIAAVIVALVLLALEIRSALISFFIAYVLMATVSPAVDSFEKKKIPRILTAAGIYLFFGVLIILLILPLIPFFLNQLQSLFDNFPTYGNLDLAGILKSEADYLGRNAVVVTGKVFGGIFGVITTIMVSFYLVLDRHRILDKLELFFGEKGQVMKHKIIAIDQKLGAWLRGQLVLSLVVGATVWLGLTLLSLPFAIPLALIAGILEIVPVMGPTLAAVFGVLVALTVSPEMALLVVGMYIIIQLLENNFLVPKVMEAAVGFSPLVVILALIIGGQLGGIAGALLAIPVTLVFSEIIRR